MKEPLCQFCRNKDGSFCYEEFHAIIMGLCFPRSLWKELIRWGIKEPVTALESEASYVAFGMSLRGVLTIATVGGMLLAARRLLCRRE